MRKKAPRYSKQKVVKSLARERVGPPPASRILAEKPARTKPKHRKPLDETGE